MVSLVALMLHPGGRSRVFFVTASGVTSWSASLPPTWLLSVAFWNTSDGPGAAPGDGAIANEKPVSAKLP